ncbi:MAG: PKD domain-containing protein [Candidatus Thermoplasmatota archaeon]
MTSEQVDELISHGINTLIRTGLDNNKVYATPDDLSQRVKDYAREAKEKNIMFFQSIFFGYNTCGDEVCTGSVIPGAYPVYFASGARGNRVSPFCEAYWKHITDIVKKLAALPILYPDRYRIDGVWFDFEVYDDYDTFGKYHNSWSWDWGFENQTFSRFFIEHLNWQQPPNVKLTERYQWLITNGYITDDGQNPPRGEYYIFLSKLIKSYAEEMKKEVEKINPDFLIGAYPSPQGEKARHYWYLPEIYSAWSNRYKPTIIWGTEAYDWGSNERLPKGPGDKPLENYLLPEGYYNLTEIYPSSSQSKPQSIPTPIYAYYISGRSITQQKFFSGRFGYHLYHLSKTTNGYWIFTSRCFLDKFTNLQANNNYYLIPCFDPDPETGGVVHLCPDENRFKQEIQAYYNQLDLAHYHLREYLLNPNYIPVFPPFDKKPTFYQTPKPSGLPLENLYPLATSENKPLVLSSCNFREQHNFIIYKQNDKPVDIYLKSAISQYSSFELNDGVSYEIWSNSHQKIKEGTFAGTTIHHIHLDENLPSGDYLLLVNPIKGVLQVTQTNTPIMIYKPYESGDISEHYSVRLLGTPSSFYFWVDESNAKGFQIEVKHYGVTSGMIAEIIRPNEQGIGYESFGKLVKGKATFSFTFDIEPSDIPPYSQNRIWKIELRKNPETSGINEAYIRFGSTLAPYIGLTDNKSYFLIADKTIMPQQQIIINAGGPYQGIVGATITFTGSILSRTVEEKIDLTWHWDFGDGSTGKGQIVSHSYDKPGNYTVKVHAVDCQGDLYIASTQAVIQQQLQTLDTQKLRIIYSTYDEYNGYFFTSENIDDIMQRAGVNGFICHGSYQIYKDYSNLPDRLPDDVKTFQKMAHDKNFWFAQGLYMYYPKSTALKPDEYYLATSSGLIATPYISPFSPGFWKRFTQASIDLAQLSVKYPEKYKLDCLFYDFEMYYPSNAYPQEITRYMDYRWGFEDQTFADFCSWKGLTNPNLPLKERFQWLLDKGYIIYADGTYTGDYYTFLAQRIRTYAEQMREAIHAINPNIHLGCYPSPSLPTDSSSTRRLYLQEIYGGLSTPDHPMILFATESYSSDGSNAIPATLRSSKLPQGAYNLTNVYPTWFSDSNPFYGKYLGGMVNYWYFSGNWGPHCYSLMRYADGYWIYDHARFLKRGMYPNYLTRWTGPQTNEVVNIQSQQEFEEEISRYYEGMKKANEEIIKWFKDPEYITNFIPGPKAVFYPKPAYVTFPPSLTPMDSPSGQIIHLSKNRFIIQHDFIIYAQQGQNVQLEVFVYFSPDTKEILDGFSWEVQDTSYQTIAKGHEFKTTICTIVFTASYTGDYMIKFNGGTFYSIQKTNAPISLVKAQCPQADFVAYPETNMYFLVENGTTTVTIDLDTTSLHYGYKAYVYDPNGKQIAHTYSFYGDNKRTIEINGITPDLQNKIWCLVIANPDQSQLGGNTVVTISSVKKYFGLTNDSRYFLKEDNLIEKSKIPKSGNSDDDAALKLIDSLRYKNSYNYFSTFFKVFQQRFPMLSRILKINRLDVMLSQQQTANEAR